MDLKNIIIFCMIMLFLLGCTSNSANVDKEEPRGEGSAGVIMKITNPLETVYEGAEKTQTIQISNPKGETTSCKYSAYSNGQYLTINGKDYFEKDIELKIRDNIRNEGYKKTISAALAFDELLDPLRYHETTVIHDLCCDFTGKVQIDNVCIDTDPENYRNLPKKDMACNVGYEGQSLSTGGCQGGPVCLNRVETKFNYVPGQSDTMIEMELLIYFSNQKDGRIYSFGSKDTVCSGEEIPSDDYGTVTMTELSFSGYYLTSNDFNCDSRSLALDPYRGKTRENEEGEQENVYAEDKISCTIELPISDPEETPLKIEYQYGYKEEMFQTITILDKNTRNI